MSRRQNDDGTWSPGQVSVTLDYGSSVHCTACYIDGPSFKTRAEAERSGIEQGRAWAVEKFGLAAAEGDT